MKDISFSSVRTVLTRFESRGQAMVCRKVKIHIKTCGQHFVLFFSFSRRESVPIHKYSIMVIPATPRRSTRRSHPAPSAALPTLRSSFESPAGRVEGGKLSQESRAGIALQIVLAMHPGGTRIRPGVASAIATGYSVGKRHASQL